MVDTSWVNKDKVPVVIKKAIFSKGFQVEARSGERGFLRKTGHSGAFIVLEESGREIYAWRNEYELLI